jgi:methylmalonyl-CoA epimerase
MAGLDRVRHIGIAVRDLEATVALYESAFGLLPSHRERIEAEGIEAVTFTVGDVEIELLWPLREDSPVGRFLAKRGEGVHHIAFGVEDVKAGLERAAAAGLNPLEGGVRPGLDGTKVAFIHPKGLNGVLTELVED